MSEPIHGPTNPSPEKALSQPVRRYGSVVGLRPEMEETYRRLHADVWTGVLDRLKRSNIQNYSIYVARIEGKSFLFSYLEYTGNDFEADMKAIASDPETRKWWKETDPCQHRLPSAPAGEQWTPLEMVFLMA